MRSVQQNIAEARVALTEKPLFATSVERFLILDALKSAYKELPQPARFSRVLSDLLSRVSVPLEPYDLIAGRCVDRVLTEEEERCFQAYIKHPDYPANTFFFSSGHGTYSWEALANEGLSGLRARAMRHLEGETDADKRVFWSATIEIYDAIIAYGLRYADAAEEIGAHETAENLRKSVTRPDSFVSVLQLFWLVTLINCAYISENPTLTVGRLDQILYPFYRADLEKGILTRERAREYITDYYCKHNLIMGRGEHQVGDERNSTTFQRISNFDAPQYLLLGGRDANGVLAVNELTELFMECVVPDFKNPVVVVRYVEGMDQACPRFWKTVCDRALDSASMMIYNDRNVYDTFRRLGLGEADARRYEHFGCNWCSPREMGAWMQNTPKSRFFGVYTSKEEARELDIPYMRSNCAHHWPEDFMIVLRELAMQPAETVSIEDFYERFFARMSDFIDRKLHWMSCELAARQRRPSACLSFSDCFLLDSIERGECFTASAKYHFELQAFQMFGTVADCFIAVDQLVMIEKKLTLGELLAATEANFEGYAGVLGLCRGAEKYGMDTPLSNRHTERLSHTACAMAIEKSRPYLERQGLFLVPCMQSDTWHLKLGEDFGATPDGRLAHTPFSQNTRPSNGACVNGLTAMFNSMLHLPHDGLVSGALNLDVDAKQFAGDGGHALFAALLATYLNRGGLHAQVSCVDVGDLIDAMENPHLHRDLRVRVTGYSGVFVDICERLQNDIIERLK
ncbi:MAG: hypothetical protein IJW30_02780 [Clostridia bacterium]|nr:hypothetical protein [Clostridia bacterium]